ncbi:MAG TPA: ABC transporter ATP-binding protein [Coriobacteriia bacterium]|nr:ABC transporter ATP-binding protein [Coriobacteriia bacterium]
MLNYENVSLTYPGTSTPVKALDRYSLTVAKGEPVALIGPSGCGKSTSLLLATGLLSPSEGEVLVDGKPVNKPRRETALILQDFGLLPWKTVFENAALGLCIRRFSKAERKTRVERALEQVGLSDFAKMYPGELSGGMRQRLALARTLALDVDVMLMDEPLSALDAMLREGLQDLLLTLWQQRGYTQVLVTHSIEEAVFLGRRIVVLSPRPGRVMTIIDNPKMGTFDYRGTEGFYRTCQLVRKALKAETSRSEGSSHGA